MAKREVIRLKKSDLDRALVRGLRKSAWEKKETRSVREKIHLSPKKKTLKPKKNLSDIEDYL